MTYEYVARYSTLEHIDLFFIASSLIESLSGRRAHMRSLSG